jgi:hypothetical protein
MRCIKLAGVCAVIAVAVTMVLVSVSYASSSSSGFEEALLRPPPGPTPASPASGGSLLDKEVAVLTDKGIPYMRALQAIDVQEVVARTDITRKVQDSTAATYGGVWFEPATAQLHVGVTSSAGRQAVDEIIAREGLTPYVVTTPVRSTMAQLLAVQKQWNHKLTHLFTLKEVKTGLELYHNAVSVTLSSSVAAQELAALKHEASVANANVSVTVVAGNKIGITQAKTACKKWEPNLAYCDASITSGVRIEGPRLASPKGEGESHKGTTEINGFEPGFLSANVFPGSTVEGASIPAGTTVTERKRDKNGKLTIIIISNAAIKGAKENFTFSYKGKGKSHKNTTLDGFVAGFLALVGIGETVEGPGIPAETRVIAKPNNTSITISKAATREEESTFTFSVGPVCSAGPLAINGKKERVMLTAGHCIGKAKEEWSAINKAEKESVVGPAENFVFGGKAGAKLGDFAEIKIEKAWQTGKEKPSVFAVTARWKFMNNNKEETSYPVEGKMTPMEKMPNCHTGQTSGESCGEIRSINQAIPFENNKEETVTVEGLVEDRGKELVSEGGDSGGPWFFLGKAETIFMEGTHTGKLEVCEEVEKGKFKTKKECEEGKEGEGKWERIKPLVYQPLESVKAGPKGPLDTFKLELLTKANE